MVGSLNVSSIATAASLAGLADKVQDVIKDTDQLAISVRAVSEATGLPKQYIMELENLAEQYGSTKDQADSFLTTLSQFKFKIAQGSADIQPFAFLGINNFENMQDVIGKISSAMNDPKRIAQWAKRFAPNAQGEKEALAAFQTQILGQIGLTPGMFEFGRQISKTNLSTIPVPTDKALENSLEAHKEWVKVAQQLNVELIDTVTHLTVAGTKILEWVNNTKAISNTFETIIRGFEILGIVGQHAQALGMNINSGLQMGLNNAHKMGTDTGKFFEGITPHFTGARSSSKVQTNNFNMQVYAQDVGDFEKKANDWLTRKLIDADRQVGKSN